MSQPGIESDVSFRPRVFRDRETPESINARSYLHRATRHLGVSALARFGKELEQTNDTELRFYGAWAHLEAALPGYFTLDKQKMAWTGLDESAVEVEHTPKSTSLDHLDEAFRIFSAIERKTRYATSTQEAAQVDIVSVDIGLRAAMMLPLKPYLMATAGDKPYSRRAMRDQFLAAEVAQGYEKRAGIFRKQLNHFLGMRDMMLITDQDPALLQKIHTLLGFIAGREAELTALGTMWFAKANGDTELLALPASIRVDYNFCRSEAQTDIVVVDPNSEQKVGLDIKRSFSRANNQAINAPNANIVLIENNVQGSYPVFRVYSNKILRLASTSGVGTGTPPFNGFNPVVAKVFAGTIEKLI